MSKNLKLNAALFPNRGYLPPRQRNNNMDNIRNLIFDFGNVLFHLDLSATERVLRERLGDQFEQAKAQWTGQDIFLRYQNGAISTAKFIDALCRGADPPLAEEEAVTAWNAIFIGMPSEYFDLLEQLRKRYRVFLLSNINDLHAQWIDRYMAQVHQKGDFKQRYFDGVYYSHLIGLSKPDRQIYAYVLRDADLKPRETVFIDDLEENVRAAEALGIRGIVKAPEVETAQLMRAFLSI